MHDATLACSFIHFLFSFSFLFRTYIGSRMITTRMDKAAGLQAKIQFQKQKLELDQKRLSKKISSKKNFSFDPPPESIFSESFADFPAFMGGSVDHRPRSPDSSFVQGSKSTLDKQPLDISFDFKLFSAENKLGKQGKNQGALMSRIGALSPGLQHAYQSPPKGTRLEAKASTTELLVFNDRMVWLTR